MGPAPRYDMLAVDLLKDLRLADEEHGNLVPEVSAEHEQAREQQQIDGERQADWPSAATSTKRLAVSAIP